MQMNITTAIVHDTRRKKITNKYPVKLRVTYRRQQRYYPFPSKYDLTKLEFKKIFGAKPRKELKEIQDVFFNERNRADEIIKKLNHRFNFIVFDRAFSKLNDNNDIFSLLQNREKELTKEERISTAVSYNNTYSSLKKYYPKKQLSLELIDPTFLNNYQKWMQEQGCGDTTVGVYTRNIRAIFNSAIKDGSISKDLYPFGLEKDKKFTIPTGRNIKKALSLSAIAAIYEYIPETDGEAKARDFWLFSYLGNGINIKDIALLKFKNIDGEMIRYQRAKSKRSNKERPIISIPYTEELKQIITRWGNKSLYEGNYVFPIINVKMTAIERYKSIQLFVAFVNDRMKSIAAKLEINVNLTTYVARHSFSTVMRNSGKSIEFISSALGHGDIKTTQNYLADFEDEVKKEAAGELLNFKKTV